MQPLNQQCIFKFQIVYYSGCKSDNNMYGRMSSKIILLFSQLTTLNSIIRHSKAIFHLSKCATLYPKQVLWHNKQGNFSPFKMCYFVPKISALTPKAKAFFYLSKCATLYPKQVSWHQKQRHFFTFQNVHTCDISRFRRELPIWSLFSRSHSRETKSPDEMFSNAFLFRPYFCPNILSFTAIIYLAGKCLTIDTC